jgi:hypothetical protein
MILCALGTLAALVFFAGLMAFVVSDPLFREPSEPDAKQNKPSNEPSKANGHASRVGVTEKPAPPTDRQNTYTTKQQPGRLEYVMFGVGLLTLGVLFAYTLVNYWLYKTTKQQLELSTQQFETTERPYVSLGNQDGKIAEYISNGTAIKLFFFNSGNGPALDFSIYIMEPGQPPLLRPERYKITTTHPDGKVDYSVGGNVAGQTGVADIPAKAVHLEYMRAPKYPAILGVTDINGIAMYCDLFGHYHCAPFGFFYKVGPTAKDFAVPFEDFLATLSVAKPQCGGLMSDPTPDITQPNGVKVHYVPLPRCRPPEEFSKDANP